MTEVKDQTQIIFCAVLLIGDINVNLGFDFRMTVTVGGITKAVFRMLAMLYSLVWVLGTFEASVFQTQ